jgi:Ca2+-transporting ATPase
MLYKVAISVLVLSKLDWLEGLIIFVVIFINCFNQAFKSYVKQKQSRSEIQPLIAERNVIVIRSGTQNVISQNELLVGDLLKIQSGETVPADGIIIKGYDLSVNEEPVTGISDNIEKQNYDICIKERVQMLSEYPELKEKIPENSGRKLKSPFVCSSSLVNSGYAYLLVLAVGSNTQKGKLNTSENLTLEKEHFLKQNLTEYAESFGAYGMYGAALTAIGMLINLIVRACYGKTYGISIEIMKILMIIVKLI